MKTKREVLKTFVKFGYCKDISCEECAYVNICNKLTSTIRKIGAREILRMFPEKRVFDKSKILTCVTADNAKVGMKGYCGDSLFELQKNFKEKYTMELKEVLDETSYRRFLSTCDVHYFLFYPIDEELAE